LTFENVILVLSSLNLATTGSTVTDLTISNAWNKIMKMDSQVGIFLSNPCEEKVGTILTLLLSARRRCRMLSLL